LSPLNYNVISELLKQLSNQLETGSASRVSLGMYRTCHMWGHSHTESVYEENYGFSFGDFCIYFLHPVVKLGLIYMSIIYNKM